MVMEVVVAVAAAVAAAVVVAGVSVSATVALLLTEAGTVDDMFCWSCCCVVAACGGMVLAVPMATAVNKKRHPSEHKRV